MTWMRQAWWFVRWHLYLKRRPCPFLERTVKGDGLFCTLCDKPLKIGAKVYFAKDHSFIVHQNCLFEDIHNRATGANVINLSGRS